MTELEFISRVALAIGAGMVIGFERQWQNKAAGMRTNTLVALGAVLYVSLSINIMATENGDVSRIIGQVVTGVGFLGAGIIFREGINVHGLTTAATIWCSSAIGSMAGAGFYFETLLATGAVVFVNLILMPIDNWLKNKKKSDDKPW